MIWTLMFCPFIVDESPQRGQTSSMIQYEYVTIPHSEWWNPILKGYISCILGPLAPTLRDQLTKFLRPLRLDFCFGPTALWKWQWPHNFLYEFPSQGISFQEQIGWIYMNFKNVILQMVSSLDVCLLCVFAGGYIHVYTQCSRYYSKPYGRSSTPKRVEAPSMMMWNWRNQENQGPGFEIRTAMTSDWLIRELEDSCIYIYICRRMQIDRQTTW